MMRIQKINLTNTEKSLFSNLNCKNYSKDKIVKNIFLNRAP